MNIGSVIYQKDFSTGNLTAIWNHTIDGKILSWTGLAKGNIKESYAGKYVVEYYLHDNSPAGTFDLSIIKEGSSWLLVWSINNIPLYTDIGQINGDSLIEGWIKTEEQVKQHV